MALPHRCGGFLKIVRAPFDFVCAWRYRQRSEYRSTGHRRCYLFLDEHRQPLEADGDLDGDWFEWDAADRLKIGELGDFHPIAPHFPAQSPGADRGRFPVVVYKADVVFFEIGVPALREIEIELLNVGWRGF